MKQVSLCIAAIVAISACSTERQAVVPPSSMIQLSQARVWNQPPVGSKFDMTSLAKMNKTNLTSKLSVSLRSLDGQLIDNVSSLRPNTTYQINLDGIGADRAEVRACLGFNILSKEEKQNKGQFSTVYLIKTQTDVADPLFVSFIPVRTVGSNLLREQTQNFWLANKI